MAKNYAGTRRGFSFDPLCNTLDLCVNGQIARKYAGNNANIYTAETTQRYPLWTPLETWDGRLFRYCYASGTCNTEVMAYKAKKTNKCAVAPTQATGAGAIGSMTVSVTIDDEIGVLTTGVLSEDELVGGYIVIGNGSAQHPQMRVITSHPALASAGGTLTLTLDAPLVIAVTASTTTIELMESPGYCVKADNSGGEYVSYIGVPASVASSGQYFWLQRRGPCWITSDGNTCDSALDRMIAVVGDGSVRSVTDVTVENGTQVVGYALDMSGSSASNAPFVYLTLE